MGWWFQKLLDHYYYFPPKKSSREVDDDSGGRERKGLEGKEDWLLLSTASSPKHIALDVKQKGIRKTPAMTDDGEAVEIKGKVQNLLLKEKPTVEFFKVTHKQTLGQLLFGQSLNFKFHQKNISRLRARKCHFDSQVFRSSHKHKHNNLGAFYTFPPPPMYYGGKR